MTFARLPSLLCAVCLVLTAATAQAQALGEAYDQVAIKRSKTSIYVGSVTLILPELERRGGSYLGSYVAKVRPYFFYGERGRLEIELSDEQLRRLIAGERVEFVGRAYNEKEELREVTGHADPTDATSGELKVRVRVTSKIELIFNTTYRFNG